MKKLLLLCPVLLFFLAQCGGQNGRPDGREGDHQKFDIEAVKAHIRAANAEYGKRFETGDSLWYAERYTQDACMMPPNAPAACGVGNIARAYYQDGQSGGFQLKITETEVSGSRRAVVEEGTYEVLMPDGKLAEKGKFIAIWAEEGGKYKLRREIWNSNDPAPPGH